MTNRFKSLVFLSPLILAACAASGPERIGAENPNVSYSYHYGDEEETRQEAAKYCYENYNRAARLVEDVRRDSGGVMTFDCVIP